jgi:DNA-binding transcriptional MerR regulator
MTDDGITLDKLSALSGVEPRTLRSWISEGLLAPPFKSGRGAQYPSSNADRAIAIRVLKDVHGLSLSEIGRRLILATKEEIRGWAEEALPSHKPTGSARDYLKSLQGNMRPSKLKPQIGKMSAKDMLDGVQLSMGPPQDFNPSTFNPNQVDDAHARGAANIERLITQLDQVLGGPVARRSRGSIWTRINITPDFEFSIRGDLQPRERALFEQLADQIRAILTGRNTQ